MPVASGSAPPVEDHRLHSCLVVERVVELDVGIVQAVLAVMWCGSVAVHVTRKRGSSASRKL